MKLKYFFGLGALALVAFFLMAAAPPAPVWRNAWTTNAGAGPVHGANNLQITNDSDLIWSFFSGSTSTVARLSDTNGLATTSYVNTATGNVANLFILNQNGSGSNLTLKSSTTTTVPYIIRGIAGGVTNQFEIQDSVGNVIGFVSSNGVYRTTNDFFATLTTTDNTTNTIYSFTPRDNSVLRMIVNIVGFNATSSASYGKYATFKSVAGTVTQVAGTSTLASAEDDSVFESLVILSGTTIQIKVAGNTGKTVNWSASGQIFYSP